MNDDVRQRSMEVILQEQASFIIACEAWKEKVRSLYGTAISHDQIEALRAEELILRQRNESIQRSLDDLASHIEEEVDRAKDELDTQDDDMDDWDEKLDEMEEEDDKYGIIPLSLRKSEDIPFPNLRDMFFFGLITGVILSLSILLLLHFT